MRSFWILARREFTAYWTSPIAYVVLAMFLVLCGFFFFAETSQFLSWMQRSGGRGVDVNQQLIRGYLSTVSVIVLFLLPLVTMRLLAEERRQGTLEVLLTTPAPEASLVLGKFAAALGLYVVMLLVPMAHVALLFLFGRPEWGPVATGFLGLFLTGGVYLAVGIFFSSVTQNQVVAAVTAFTAFLVLWLCQLLGTVSSGRVAEVLAYVSLAGHFDNFGRGVLDTSDVVFYLSWIAAGLYGSVESVRAARWKP